MGIVWPIGIYRLANMPMIYLVLIHSCFHGYLLVDFRKCQNKTTYMAPRTGRLRTGRKPNLIVRMNPEHAAAAGQSARDAVKQVGQWLEEAITEKREREQGEEDVTKADS